MTARLLSWLASEHRRNPWMAPGVALSAAAAFGSALPDLIALVGRIVG